MKCRRAWRQLLFVKVLFVLLSLAKCVDSALASNRIRGSATLSKTSLKRHSAAASNLQHFRVMASHQDQYRDTFPISLSPSMYNRVMEMRKLMRLQFDDVDDLRGTTPISNDSRLRECRSQDGEKVPWAFTHQIVGHPFTDGIGHSLVTFMRQLYIAIMYGCRSTLPTRYMVKRNFIFLPWDDENDPTPHGSDFSDYYDDFMPLPNELRSHHPSYLRGIHENFRSGSPKQMSEVQKNTMRAKMTWLQDEPSRFLYCHQRKQTFEFKFKARNETEEFLLSDDFRRNMNCYISYVDPWRILCNVALGGECSTELVELQSLFQHAKKVSAAGNLEQSTRRSLRTNAQAHNSKPAAYWQSKGFPSYIVIDKLFPRFEAFGAKVPIDGLPSPTSKQSAEAVRRMLLRTQHRFWDAIERARQRNVNQPQNSGELIKLRARSETRWSCGYDDHTLDVAVHLRRGDLYQSNYTLDIDRYLPMSYFGDLVRNISAAWEGSTALRKMYPTIRFHVHSESARLPPPYGLDLELPEFENVTFLPRDAYSCGMPTEEAAQQYFNANAEPAVTATPPTDANISDSSGQRDEHVFDTSLVCPVGRLAHEKSENGLLMRFCLNINPLQSLYCMAKADVFTASTDSYFSALISVTAPSVKIVPQLHFFEGHLCDRTDICNVNEELMLTNGNVTATTLYDTLLLAQERHAEEIAIRESNVAAAK